MKQLPKFKEPVGLEIAQFKSVSVSLLKALELRDLNYGLFGKAYRAMLALQDKYLIGRLTTVYTEESFNKLCEALVKYKANLLEWQTYKNNNQ